MLLRNHRGGHFKFVAPFCTKCVRISWVSGVGGGLGGHRITRKVFPYRQLSVNKRCALAQSKQEAFESGTQQQQIKRKCTPLALPLVSLHSFIIFTTEETDELSLAQMTFFVDSRKGGGRWGVEGLVYFL